jgi:hypothetical protein
MPFSSSGNFVKERSQGRSSHVIGFEKSFDHSKTAARGSLIGNPAGDFCNMA